MSRGSKVVALATVGLLVAGPARGQRVETVQVAPERLTVQVGEQSHLAVTAYAGANVVAAPAIQWHTVDSTIVRVLPDPASPAVATVVGLAVGSTVVEVYAGRAHTFTIVQVTPAAGAAAAASPSARAGAFPAGNLATLMEANRGAVALVRVYAGTDSVVDATGFVITPSGYLVTVRHAVNPGGRVADSVLVIMADHRLEEAQRAEIVSAGAADGPDLAVLRIPDYRGSNLRRLDWAAKAAREGTPAAVIGFAGGLANSVDAGGVVRPSMAAGIVSKVSADVIQWDGFTSAGSGGSPVFNAAGEVTAVHRSRIAGGLALAVPMAQLEALLPADAKAELGIQ